MTLLLPLLLLLLLSQLTPLLLLLLILLPGPQDCRRRCCYSCYRYRSSPARVQALSLPIGAAGAHGSAGRRDGKRIGGQAIAHPR